MRARVLLTNGSRTVDLLWISHDGRDVYCGLPKSDFKRSFHESGKIHTDVNGLRRDEEWVAPLADLKGQFNLGTLSIGPPQKALELMSGKYEYSGKKSDAVVVLDARCIPDNYQASIAYGLLEPGNFGALGQLLGTRDISGFGTISCEQIMLSTSVSPWVYVLLYWWNNAT